MDNREPSVEEKIDYIYNRLRKQQKIETIAAIIKWGTRLFIVLSIAYFFFIKLPALKDDIIDGLKPDLPDFNTENITNSEFINSLKERFMGDDEVGVTDQLNTENKNNTDTINY